MRYLKISFLFIFLLLALFVPNQPNQGQQGSNDTIRTNQTSGPQLGQVGIPPKEDLNASIVDVARNITISASSQIVLQDRIQVDIKDNLTEISTFYYTIPTIFDKYVVKATFWSQFNTSVGLTVNQKLKQATHYRGDDVSVYSIDIRENETDVANFISAEGGLHIQVKLEASDAIKYENLGDDQVGRFFIPVLPFFPNLPVEGGVLGVKLDADQDDFQVANITKINYANQDWPVQRDASANILEWRNTTAVPYDFVRDLELNYDYTELVFKSQTVGSNEKSGTTVPFKYTEAQRVVRIDPWGVVYVTETLTVQHEGASRIEFPASINLDHEMARLEVTISNQALVTDVYDKLGSLNQNTPNRDSNGNPTTHVSTDTGKQTMNVNFRNPIFGGEAYTFTYEYHYNSSSVMNVDGSNFVLNTTLFSDFNQTIDNLEVIFELPAGGKFTGHTFVSRSQNSLVEFDTLVKRDTLSFFRHLEFKITIVNASYVDNTQFELMYSYNGLGHFQFIISFFMGMVLILSLIVAVSGIKFESKVAIVAAKEAIPVEEIETFFKVFSERQGASKRVSDLRSRRKKGKISKKDFDGQLKAVQKRIRELNPQLETASAELSDVGGKYQILVERLMLASQRQIDIRSNAASARRTYRAGDTSKDIYQKLISNYNKDLTRQESTINKTLTELLEIASVDT